jgi:hypothetical protein
MDSLALDILTGQADRRIDAVEHQPREIRLTPLPVIDPSQVKQCARNCADCTNPRS